MEIKEQLKESEVTQTSEMLKGFGYVINEVMARRKPIEEVDSIIDAVEELLKGGQLNTFDRLMSYYVLGQACNTKKCFTQAPSQAMYNHPLMMNEIFCYRMTLRIADDVRHKKLWALYNTVRGCEYQTYVHLGNVYDHLGRHQEALHSYFKAGLLMPDDYMWQFNLGFSYGGMFGYYENRVQPFVVAKAKDLLKQFLNKPETTQSVRDMYRRISGLKTPAKLDEKNVDYGTSEEDEYNMWVNENYLRLNGYNEINPASLYAQDDSLYFDFLYTAKGAENESYRMMSLLNEIKQEYVSARFMLYSYFKESGKVHFSDKKVQLADMLDYSNYSYHVELAKAAFRSLYSLLDKIAFSLNGYLGLGINGKEVSFKGLWYSDKKSRNIRAEIVNYSTVISLAGLLFIRNDIYGGNEYYLQAEETKNLQKVRNAMEHRAIQIVDDGQMEDNEAVLIISRGEFEEVAMNLIATVREAIFCFVNAVKHIEYDKTTGAKKQGIVMESMVGSVMDEEKV
ncbi:MAG: hypothetical protein IJ209_10480 [Bacteroidaceae bacterium]|nr:hypothetical protein [Bacteroidaceae bacterium]